MRLDANNLWKSPQQCEDHLAALPAVAFAIEEPLPAGDVDGCTQVAGICGLRVIGDNWFTAYLPTVFHLVLALEVMVFAACQRSRPQQTD